MIDRQAWLEARRKGIGGTDAAAILGLSKYRTRIDVWEDKLGINTVRIPSDPMRWGLKLEATIAEAFTEETGILVRKTPMRVARHVTALPMFGSLDRQTIKADPPAVLEIKTARTAEGFGPRDDWRDLPPEKRIPPDHYVQLQHYLEVTQLPLGYLAVLIGGSDFRVFEIPRDRDFGADLIEEEADFWNRYVLTREQPPVTAGDLEYLSRKYPTSSELELVATAEQARLVEAYLDVDRELKSLEALRDTVRANLEEVLGEASKLTSSAGTVKWRSHDRTTVAWKGVAAGYRTLLEKLRETARSRGMHGTAEEITTALEGLESLYSSTASVRPFSVEGNDE